MQDSNITGNTTTSNDTTSTTTSAAPRRRRTASRAAGPPATPDAPEAPSATDSSAAGPVAADGDATRASTPRARRARTKATVPAAEAGEVAAGAPDKPARRTRKKADATPVDTAVISAETTPGVASAPGVPVLFQAPQFTAAEAQVRPARAATKRVAREDDAVDAAAPAAEIDDDESDADDGPRKRRRRGGRGRHKKAAGDTAGSADDGDTGDGRTGAGEPGDGERSDAEAADDGDEGAGEGPDEGAGDGTGATRRRRRRRRRKGDAGTDETQPDDPPDTVVRVREARHAADSGEQVTSVKGSTRLEAKKQRRREGREAGRRRPPVISEAEFLARREAVDRVMVVRQTGDRIQIGVLEDGVLVEHYVSRSSQQSMVGNAYLGRVQNVLPAMEAAFIDIGRGRNAILYAGEVDWAGLGKPDGPRRIEEVLKSGQSVLVQVTKDPIGHKGARLTGQVSLPGRYVVFVPGGSMSGISRKLPDTERNRLKTILKQVVPEDSGVIVRTAAEGASEEELTNDVNRLRAQWEDIVKKSSGNAPQLLYGEPDLAIKVVRDLFNEDFSTLVVSGDDAWDTVESYVSYVASSLRDRLERWTGDGDVFAAHRIDEQIAKALDRKVWLPSGGSLVIDRTEAMTVVDVNTGKFTGSGGNLEETVTKNNLEAAEEIVRQLRLRDIGGIIVIDFIDMVLEANRDLVLRRLVECLGRDRTKHQVAEVTSLGLVQMTRKRIGVDLLEAFSEPCETCKGRGVIIHHEPVESAPSSPESGTDTGGGSRRGRRRRGEPTAPAEAVTPEPATPPRRSRRRAQRPAGEPAVATEQVGATG